MNGLLPMGGFVDDLNARALRYFVTHGLPKLINSCATRYSPGDWLSGGCPCPYGFFKRGANPVARWCLVRPRSVARGGFCLRCQNHPADPAVPRVASYSPQPGPAAKPAVWRKTLPDRRRQWCRRQLALAHIPLSSIHQIFITHNHDDTMPIGGHLDGIAWRRGTRPRRCTGARDAVHAQRILRTSPLTSRTFSRGPNVLPRNHARSGHSGRGSFTRSQVRVTAIENCHSTSQGMPATTGSSRSLAVPDS